MAVTQMAQSEPDPDNEEPQFVELKHREKKGSGVGRFFFHPTDAALAAGLDDFEFADVRADLEDPAEPMLVIGGLPDEMDIDPQTDPHARRVSTRTGRLDEEVSNVEISVPHRALDEDGLGLDLEDYEDHPPLRFAPLVDEGLLGLIPAEFADGTPYVPPAYREPGESAYEAGRRYLREQGEVEPEADTEAESAAETSVSLVDQERTEQVAGMYGVDAGAVTDAIQALAEHEDLAAVADSENDDYPPLDADDRRIWFVPEDEWADLVAELSLENADRVRPVLRAVAVQVAEDVLAEQDAIDAYHGFDRTHVPVIARE